MVRRVQSTSKYASRRTASVAAGPAGRARRGAWRAERKARARGVRRPRTGLHGIGAGPVLIGRGPQVVGARRFELPTSCSRSRRATKLRYAPTACGGVYPPPAGARTIFRGDPTAQEMGVRGRWGSHGLTRCEPGIRAGPVGSRDPRLQGTASNGREGGQVGGQARGERWGRWCRPERGLAAWLSGPEWAA